MFKKLVGFLIRFRASVIIVMGLITVFFVVQIRHMQMFTQFIDLFPHNHPYVEIHKAFARYFGGAYQATLMLQVKDGNVFNSETLRKMERIQYAVDLIPGVDHFAILSVASPMVKITKETPAGFSTTPIMKEVPKDEQELRSLKKRIFTSPVNGTLVSRDQKALLLTANFIEGRIDFNKLFDEFKKIKEKEEDASHKIYLSGTPLVYGWIYHYLPNMALILGISLLIILAMLYLYMNQGGLWWWPFIGAILCSIWGLGFAAWTGFHFDPLIIVIPFLLSARAMSHGVQWVERFVEEYQKSGGNSKEAAFITGTGLFPPGLIGIVADTVALLIIAMTPIPILKNLAYLAAFWCAGSIFTILVLFPPLFSLFKTVRVPKKSDVPTTASYRVEYFTEKVIRRILVKLSSWTFGKGRYITVGIAGVVLIVAVISSMSLKYGDANPGDPILWPDSEYNVNVKQINDCFPGVDQMWVVFEGKSEGAINSPDVVKGMEAMKYYMMKDPNVGFATSIADIIKNINMLLHGNDPKMLCIPETASGIESMMFLFRMGSPPGELDAWVEPTYHFSNVRLFLKNHEGKVLEEVIGRIMGFIKDNPTLMENAVPKPAGGLGGILVAANETIASKNEPTLLIVLTGIFILCSVVYRSVLAGVIFTLSLILANFLAFTYMTFKGIGLNINTFPVVSLGIGMGVDYGLYIVSRIIEEYHDKQDLEAAVRGGITTAGRAVFFTATMMTAGVVSWYFSPLRFQAEMGILLGILMTVNMLVGVIVLPAVINILKPKFITHTKTHMTK